MIPRDKPLRQRGYNPAFGIPLDKQKKQKAITLIYNMPLGDTCCLTASLCNIKLAYPDMQIGVHVTHQELFWFNDLCKLGPLPNSQLVRLNKDSHSRWMQTAKNKNILHTDAILAEIAEQTKLNIKPIISRPQITIAEHEYQDVDRYCLINPGYRKDNPCKWAGTRIWQEFADWVNTQNLKVIQVGSDREIFYNPRLRGVIDLVGQTTVRELCVLTKQSLFTVSAESALNHIAAGCNVPSIVVGGGVISPERVSYDSTHYLHTFGELECCQDKPCHKNALEIFHGNKEKKSLCSLPMYERNGEFNFPGDSYTIPRCMQLIGSERIIEVAAKLL